MSNHKQMTAAGSAALEIEFLRDELSRARAQANDTNHCKAVLKRRGFFIDMMWKVEDVQTDYECDDEDAYMILRNVLTHDNAITKVFDDINAEAEKMNLPSKK